MRWYLLVLAPTAAINLAGQPCPLTVWEKHFWRLAGETPYQGGFVSRYFVEPFGAPGLRPGEETLILIAVVSWCLVCLCTPPSAPAAASSVPESTGNRHRHSGLQGGRLSAPLPEGLVAVVKRDCPTCELVVPVLEDLQGRAGLTVITQDDPAFPAAAGWVLHDDDLAFSWHNGIETVPTLLRVTGGAETGRTEGWSRQNWEQLSGIDGLGDGLPAHRPGCGSLSVDPAHADRAWPRASAVRASAVDVSSWPPRRTPGRPCGTGAGPTGCRWYRQPPSGCCACSRAQPAGPTTSWRPCHPTWPNAPSRRLP